MVVVSVISLIWWSPPFEQANILKQYQQPAHRYAAGHRGIDFVASTGDPFISPTDGVVTFSGKVVDRGVLTIQVTELLLVTFEPVITDLNVGDTVAKNQIIGSVASGGHCQKECLHIGVREKGEYVNPLKFFGFKPILLPLDF